MLPLQFFQKSKTADKQMSKAKLGSEISSSWLLGYQPGRYSGLYHSNSSLLAVAQHCPQHAGPWGTVLTDVDGAVFLWWVGQLAKCGHLLQNCPPERISPSNPGLMQVQAGLTCPPSLRLLQLLVSPPGRGAQHRGCAGPGRGLPMEPNSPSLGCSGPGPAAGLQCRQLSAGDADRKVSRHKPMQTHRSRSLQVTGR